MTPSPLGKSDKLVINFINSTLVFTMFSDVTGLNLSDVVESSLRFGTTYCNSTTVILHRTAGKNLQLYFILASLYKA